MQLTERPISGTNPPHPPHPRQAPPGRLWRSLYRRVWQGPPRTILGTLAILFRLDATPAFLAPPIVGAVLGWWQTGTFQWGLLGVLVLGTLAAFWGTTTLSEYFDYRRSRFVNVQAINEPYYTGLSLIQRAHLRPQVTMNLGLILLALAAVCALWLGLLGGWAVLFFYGLAVIMAIGTAAAPLLKFTYVAWTFVELCRYIAFGFLPLLAGYYTQAPSLYLLPLSIAAGYTFFVAAVLFAQRIIHLRRDWLLQKRTMSVVLGPARSLDMCVFFVVAGFVALLLGASLTALPLWTLLTLLALPVALRRFAHVRRDELTLADSISLFEAGISATTLTAILLIVALLIDGLG